MTGGKKVPVEVAASGPKVIAIAALQADRVMFTLGADVERLRWGLELARETRVKAGLDPYAIAYGVYVKASCHTDINTARVLVRGGLTSHARFSVMHGKATGPLQHKDREVLENIHRSYNMRKHTRGDSEHATAMTDDFVDRFAIVGSPDRVADRLLQLADMGFDKVIISHSSRGVEKQIADEGQHYIEREMVPLLRERLGQLRAPSPAG